MTDRRRVVRHDPAMATAPLFRPLQKGEGVRPKLDLRQEFGGSTIWYRGPDALGVSDQTVLFAVLCLAQKKGKELLPSTTGHYTRRALADLLPVPESYPLRTVYVDTTLYEMLQTAAMRDDGRSYKQLRDCIDRLAAVTVFVDRGGNSPPPMRLLSRVVKDDGRIKLALNERLALAFVGQYVTIDLRERQRLPSDAAKVLHAWLSATVRRGRAWNCTIDKLAYHIYGDSSGNDLRRKRRERTKEALESISRLPGWSASISDGVACIVRDSGARTTTAVNPAPVISVTHCRDIRHAVFLFIARQYRLFSNMLSLYYSLQGITTLAALWKSARSHHQRSGKSENSACPVTAR